MGSVFQRGSTSKRLWYIKYRDLDGTWKMMNSGQATKAQARQILAQVESRIAAGKVGLAIPAQKDAKQTPRSRELMRSWAASLTNRNAVDDRQRLERHLIPVFGDLSVADITLAVVMKWIDDMRAAGKLADGSIRHNLNLLGRFFGWAVLREHATMNPVRLIPSGSRPREVQRRDTPWLDDDAIVRKVFHELPEPFNLMFYLGNRSGLRLGEIVGLRLSDLDPIAAGTIRVRFSHEGPLKEDKGQQGKMKWVPAPNDAAALFRPWLALRRSQGGQPEELLFPCKSRQGRPYRKELLEARWEAVARKLGLRMTFYEATRHSFVSRSLSRGASLDEVSSAVGHSSPIVTRRYYDHFVRQEFSPTLREGLGLGGERPADIIPLRHAKLDGTSR
jgi:integrase